ncbi:MAG: DUF4173 domain-containing protein [Candidatus Paceibacterota bacterium]|jgi:hypothetical protein
METFKKINNAVVLGVAAILLGLAHNFLFFEKSPGINFFLFAALILAIGWAVNLKFGRSVEKQKLVLFLPILFFSFMIFVRSSELLAFFNAVASVLLFFILARSCEGKPVSDFLPEDYAKIFFLPFKFIAPFWKTLSEIFIELFAIRKIAKNHPHAREIARGTLMSLVALLAFTLLFSQADESFNNFVQSIVSFNWRIDEEVFGRIILFVLVSSFFIGAFGYAFGKREENAGAPEEKTRNAGALEMKIFLGSINVLFFIFIILQLEHLFGGGGSVLSEGITYAAYARKGFYELMLAAILSYAIIATAENQIAKNGNSHFRSFKLLSAALIVQTVAILFSAFMRLSLYENAYGFSTIRLYSHALMIWVGVVLFLLMRHILGGGTRTKFAMQVFVCVILLLFSMNLINPDAFIAKRNLERYELTGRIDAAYLANLSDDAIPYTAKLLDDPDETVRSNFAKELYPSLRHRTKATEEGWQSFQISRARAQKILSPKEAYIKTIWEFGTVTII